MLEESLKLFWVCDIFIAKDDRVAFSISANWLNQFSQELQLQEVAGQDVDLERLKYFIFWQV